jgi:hypothetical protein
VAGRANVDHARSAASAPALGSPAAARRRTAAGFSRLLAVAVDRATFKIAILSLPSL